MEHWELIAFFFGVALLYGSVGFGGGSSYLAILVLYGFDMLDIRSTALLCNIAVVTGSVILYSRNHLIEWKRVLPLVAVSVPLAFVGGGLLVGEQVFFIVLAAALLVAALLMWFQPQVGMSHTINPGLPVNLSIGGGIGFLAGMVGIGGGIFLSPMLHLIRWASPKVIAATAAVFILVNSFAGLAGQATNPEFRINWTLALPLICAVVVGGQIGSRLGISYFSQTTVKRATACLVCYVSLRIFYEYLIK